MFDQNKILLSEKDKDLGKWLKESYLDDWNITVFDTRNRMTVRKWTKVEKKRCKLNFERRQIQLGLDNNIATIKHCSWQYFKKKS